MNSIQNAHNLIASESTAVMTSLEIAEMTGKQHKHILRDIEDEKSKISDICTQPIFWLSSYRDSTGRELPMYRLTKKGVMQLGARYDAKIRFKLIAKLEQMEQTQTPTLPKNYLEALKALVMSEEHRQQLTAENEIMKPKAEYFDELVDRNLLTTFRETARELNVKEGLFIDWLLSHRYVYRKPSGRLMPYADKDKLFEVKERLNHKSLWSGVQTYITPKGRETFLRLYAANNNRGGLQ